MKIAAVFCGILASAIAWAASYFVADISGDFLALWPQTTSQQFLGLILWHGIIALPLVGGLLAVVSPVSGGVLLAAAAGIWLWLGFQLPAGFIPQVAVPMVFAGLGALSAFGASIRGLLRRRAEMRQPLVDEEELEREEALRFEPTEDLARAVEARSYPQREQVSLNNPAEAIVPVAANARRDGPPPGVSGLVVVNALLLVILTLAVGVLLYSDFRNGNLANAFSTLPFASAAPGPAALEAPADTASSEVPEPEPEPSSEPPAPAEAADAELRVSSIPFDPASLPLDEWDDPFAYCEAVGTIDFPDSRYAGPAVTEPIAEALRVPVNSPPDRVRWRCVDGAVLGCSAFRGANCSPTPSATEMIEFCSKNPNVNNLLAPNGTWSCVDSEPVIPPDQVWPADGRGFLPGAWVAISPPDDQVT